MAESQLERDLKRRFREMFPEYEDRTTAITGYVSPTTGALDPNPLVGLAGTGLIWIHAEDGRSSTPAIIGPGLLNLTNAAGIRVKTGINSKGERVAIGPVDDSQNAAINQQYHNAAQQAVYVESRQFTPGLVTAWSAEVGGNYGLFVYVHPFPYTDKEPHGPVDVSASVPGSTGERRQAVISYRVSTDEFLVTNGTSSLLPANAWMRADAVTIALPFTDCIRLGAVLLTNGDTTVTESTPFYDLRDLVNRETGTTTVDAVDVTYTPTTSGDWPTPPTDVQEALDELATLTAAGFSYQNSTLGSDVTMTTGGTFYDAVSVSLTAGTWWVSGNVTCNDPSFAGNFTAKLWDGTTIHASAENNNRASGVSISVPIPSQVIVLSGTTTIKISVAASAGNNNCTIKAATLQNASGNTATWISALKIA